MRLIIDSWIESSHETVDQGFALGRDEEKPLKNRDELSRENEALRDRISKLSAAILRISVSPDVPWHGESRTAGPAGLHQGLDHHRDELRAGTEPDGGAPPPSAGVRHPERSN